jgi:hypothetical protein
MPNLKQQSKINQRKKKNDDSSNVIKPKLSEEDKNDPNIKCANDLWVDLKKRVASDPTFAELPDKEKVEIFQNGENKIYKEFYNTYPIVCRYMICMGQFSNIAFKRFLEKCKNMEKTLSKEDKEEQWVMRQADYVRYLWEAYQKNRFDINEAKYVWKHAYETLSKELKDFKNMHDKTEEKLKAEEKYNKSALVKELVKRVANGDQKLSGDSEQHLIKGLKARVAHQRRRKLLDSIKNLPRIPPTRICRGSVKETTN